MEKLNIPSNVSLQEMATHLLEYIRPWEDMWPWYRVTLFGIRVENKWFLVYGSWAARVTPLEFPYDRDELLDNSMFVTKLITMVEAQRLLGELATSGTVTWINGNEESLTFELSSHAGNRRCGDLPTHPKGYPCLTELEEVAEQFVSWRVAWASMDAPWMIDKNEQNNMHWEDITSAVAQEYGVATFDEILSQLLGIQNARGCRLDFDFPLGLGLQISRQENGTSILHVSCQEPLSLNNVSIRPALNGIFSRTIPPIEIQQTPSTSIFTEWKNHGMVGLQEPCTKFFVELNSTQELQHVLTGLKLQYAIGDEPDETVLAKVIADFYQGGSIRWKKHLFEGKDKEFEIAVANLLARFRCPVLFGGAVAGLQADGIDLVVLHPQGGKKAALVSCKGGESQLTNFKIWDNLLKAVDEHKISLSGWEIHPIVATHLTSSEIDAQYKRHNFNCKLWGSKELALLFNASNHQEIEHLLWSRSDPETTMYSFDGI